MARLITYGRHAPGQEAVAWGCGQAQPVLSTGTVGVGKPLNLALRFGHEGRLFTSPGTRHPPPSERMTVPGPAQASLSVRPRGCPAVSDLS